MVAEASTSSRNQNKNQENDQQVVKPGQFLFLQCAKMVNIHWPWKNDDIHRQKAASAFNQLVQTLLEHHSATIALEEWCRCHKISASSIDVSGESLTTSDTNQGRITAQQMYIHGQPQPPLSSEERALLNLLPGEELGYRHVHLMFNGAAVSKADNWYVASRLDSEMNDVLMTTDVPFGKVVERLSCYRATVSIRPCFPMPFLFDEERTMYERNNVCRTDKNETQSLTAGEKFLQIPDVILEMCAVVHRGDDARPLCYVRERYQSKLMDFLPALHTTHV